MAHLGAPHEPTIAGIIIALCVAGFGGIAKTLNAFLKGEPLQTARLLAQTIVSMFTGYMFYELAFYFEKEPLGVVIAGLGGWWGAEGIDFIIRKYRKQNQ